MYFGTDQNNLPLRSTVIGSFSSSQGLLEPGTTYYWRIDTENDGGATTGNVWSFTTVEGAAKATGPSPADGATGVATTASLDWDDAAGASQYRIYLGTDQSNLPLVGTRVASDFNPAGDFDLDTTYYWRVDTDAGGGVHYNR